MRTKEQLLQELNDIRKRLNEIETAETERKVIEAYIEGFKYICENAEDIVYIVDKEGKVVYVNKILEKYSGYTPEESIGKLFAPFFEGDNLKKANTTFKKALAGESHQEEIAFSKSGVICEYKSLPFRNNEGEIIGVIGTARDLTDRIQKEKMLKESRERLKEAQRLANIGSWSWIIATDSVIWSDELYQIAGLDPTLPPPTYEKHPKLFTAKSWKKLDRAVERAVQKGEFYEVELDIVRPTGEIRHTHARGKAVKDESGQVVRLFGTVQDITERKKINDALMLSQFTLDHSPDAVYWMKPDGRFFYVNETAVRTLGYTREELLTMGVKDIDPGYPRGVPPEMSEATKKVGIGSVETEHRTKEGRIIPVEVMVAYIEYEGNEYHCSSVRDITERKKLEEALQRAHDKLEEKVKERTVELSKTVKALQSEITDRKRAEERMRKSREDYKSLVETSPHGIQENDLSGRITFSNKALCNMLGYEQGALVGKYIWDFYEIEEKRKELRQYLKMLVKEQPPPIPYMTKDITKDGKLIDVQVDWNYKRDNDGRLTGFISVITDVTARKRAENEKLTHLHYFKSMSQIDETLHKTMDIDETLREVLQKVLSIFDCDRSWLLYPCDPDAPTYSVPYECTRPEYPGAFSNNENIPSSSLAKDVMNMALASREPVPFVFNMDAKANNRAIRYYVEKYGIQSQITTSIRPKKGKPWLMGLHQCSYQREWSKEEQRLFKDISLRMEDALTNKLLYQDMQQSEEKYRRLINSANDAILIADAEKGIILDANKKAEQLIGIPVEELIGMHQGLLYPKKETKYYTKVFQETLAKGEEITGELFLCHKDGRKIPVEISASTIEINGNKLIQGMFRDISERKQAEEALREKSEDLKSLTIELRDLASQFSKEDEMSRRKYAQILHEQLGQALAAIKIKCCNILEDTSSSTAEIKEVIYDIVPIVNDTIESTRRLTSELYPVVLDRLGFIPAVGWYSDLLLKPNKLKVTTNIDGIAESLPSDDKLSLFRIVQEAFHNITKHASATEVDIELKKVNRSIQLIIEDNGIGCDMKKIEKKKKRGIGLMLMKERAVALGGDLIIACALKKGTKLSVEIPIKK